MAWNYKVTSAGWETHRQFGWLGISSRCWKVELCTAVAGRVEVVVMVPVWMFRSYAEQVHMILMLVFPNAQHRAVLHADAQVDMVVC